MGWFFLFREVRPRGDVPRPGVLKRQEANKTKIRFPPSQVTTNQIFPAKQPIMK
jgi:hypothetical protein